MSFTPENILIIGIISLLGIGIYGLLAVRNMIKLIVVLQVLVKTALLAMVTAGHVTGNIHQGESFALTILAADTVVAIVGLAIAVQVQQKLGTLDISDLSELRN